MLAPEEKEYRTNIENAAYLGLMYGDALSFSLGGLSKVEAEAHFLKKAQYICHSATTTWALLVKQILKNIENENEGTSQNIKQVDRLRLDLTLVLDVFAKTYEGTAFRGPSRTLSSTLLKVASGLELGVDSSYCGSDLNFTDSIAHLLPLVFLERGDGVAYLDVAVEVISVTHRHSGMAAASAYWIGATRAYLAGQREDALLDSAMDFSQQFLKHFLKRHRGHLVDSISRAEGALSMAHAMISSAFSYNDLLTPNGFDSREIPSRLIGPAIYLLAYGGGNLSDLDELLQHGGDMNVMLPTISVSYALINGVEHLPISWSQRLSGYDLLQEKNVLAILKTELKFSNEISIQKKQEESSLKMKSKKQLRLL